MSSQVVPTADIRRRFLDFFAARGHEVVPSSSLIPNDPTLLLTTAGMVQFKPYLTGAETPPYPRATSIQKCARTTDIDVVGASLRHLTFFEMLGNFSLGDYFKDDAIPWAWELCTDQLGYSADDLWVTVHESDDDAARIWREVVGVAADRIQRLGEDNFWSMGTAGPCGPCSEIFVDKGPEFGREGGPAVDDDRYVEIYNLVFMQYLRDQDGEIVGDLPRPSIDTGAGLERTAATLNGLDSVFDSDTILPVRTVAEEASGVEYGADPSDDISLRILADHGRSATFLVTDGVFPSNEERGYVLRRVLRRAVRHAWRLGVNDLLTPELAKSVIATMGDAYPELARNADTTAEILANEEERFRDTLKAGMNHLETALASGLDHGKLPGSVAFKLHDTYGFPIEVTQEIAAERQVEVDMAGFRAEMDDQRSRARAARRRGGPHDTEPTSAAIARKIGDSKGATAFLGYETTDADGQVIALVTSGAGAEHAGAGTEVELFADRTPFYAESGGQIGDTGEITVGDARMRVDDTQYAAPVFVAHRGEVVEGEIRVGDEARFVVDAERRAGLRRNHTATHLLHWALREVLGEHVRQQGSIVLPDRLRFDFSHYAAMIQDELAAVEKLANREMLTNAEVKNYETTKSEADANGVLSFFGDKYGERVRVLEAGANSRELCGGTHVHDLGEIGPIVITSESSIGSNLRRIEALTGPEAMAYLQQQRATLRDAAELLHSSPEDVPETARRRIDELAQLRRESDVLRAQVASGRAGEIAAQAFALDGGARAVVARLDDVASAKDLQRRSTEIRGKLAPAVAVLGASFGGKASLVSAVSKDLQSAGLSASDSVRQAATVVGGGTGKNPDVAMAGGPRGELVDDALAAAREYLMSWSGTDEAGVSGRGGPDTESA